MTYGVTAGISQNVSNTDEYVYITGSGGTVVKHFKKYKRIETVTETLPDSFAFPGVSGTTAFRQELRLSNTDFARLTNTAVTFSTI
jgi:4-diphosphocytidyl-2C-methyl-D-erythritol kinase